MTTGAANLPLHHGSAARWLLRRMVCLACATARGMMAGGSATGSPRQPADPHCLQAFARVLGLDWRCSDSTITSGDALRHDLLRVGNELELYAAGERETSWRIIEEIRAHAPGLSVSPLSLIHSSRTWATVDHAAIRDGYPLYHHVVFFERQGRWTIVQQDMSAQTRHARRYPWPADSAEELIPKPYSATCRR
ncbi:MAG: DUF763 domain-containing protein [Anaerolineae bacterium]|nr:DUF763 domain-containing protein [Anaerolineae bacterium]